MNKIFWGGLLISAALHLAAALWFYLKAPEFWQSTRPQAMAPLSVKLTTAVVISEEPAAPIEPQQDAVGTEKVAEPINTETRAESPPNEASATPKQPTTAIELIEPAPIGEVEKLDLSASRFSVSELNLSGSEQTAADYGSSSQGAYSGVFDPRLRSKLQASAQNRNRGEPDSFEIMNNKKLGNGSERVSFGDACFEVTDAIGGGTNEKQVFRTNCLGKRDLSERMMDNVNRSLEDKDEL